MKYISNSIVDMLSIYNIFCLFNGCLLACIELKLFFIVFFINRLTNVGHTNDSLAKYAGKVAINGDTVQLSKNALQIDTIAYGDQQIV